MAELNTPIDEKVLDEMIALIRADQQALLTEPGFALAPTKLRAAHAEQYDERLFRNALRNKELSRVPAILGQLQPLFYSVLFSKNCRRALDAVTIDD